MRTVVALAVVPAALGAVVGSALIVWRRNPRFGSGFVNTVVNPRLVERGLVGGDRSELGTLEHVGRTSGVRRLTPVHPEPTQGGFRIVAPLGRDSQWVRNVVAAGHCRLQLHQMVYELDEPVVLDAAEAEDLPAAVRRAMTRLGFQYLKLRTFASAPGTLDQAGSEASAAQALMPSDPPGEAFEPVVLSG